MGCKHGKEYTRCIMRAKYGSRAFNKDGTLKLEYLRKMKAHQEKKRPKNVYAIRAVTEAINFKR